MWFCEERVLVCVLMVAESCRLDGFTIKVFPSLSSRAWCPPKQGQRA